MFENVVTLDELLEEKQRLEDSNKLLEIKKEHLQNSIKLLEGKRDSLYNELRQALDAVEEKNKSDQSLTVLGSIEPDNRNFFSKLFSRIF